MSGALAAKDGQPRVTIAVGGASCLCYLPTMLAEQLGNYKKAGIQVERADFKGGSITKIAPDGTATPFSAAAARRKFCTLPS